LRAVLDHIFKAVELQDIEEIKKAEGHINRAGYDAYEVYSSSLLNKIREKQANMIRLLLLTFFLIISKNIALN
jgi:hypothetical protein